MDLPRFQFAGGEDDEEDSDGEENNGELLSDDDLDVSAENDDIELKYGGIKIDGGKKYQEEDEESDSDLESSSIARVEKKYIKRE